MKSRKRTHIVRPFKVNSRDSAYQIEFAVQIPKIRGHVPRSAAKKPRKDGVRFFILLEGESFDHREELLDDFGTACGPFFLSAKLQFCDSLRADQRSALFLSLSA